MELFKDLNWLLVLAFLLMAIAPLVFVPKPIKDRRWLAWTVFFIVAGVARLIYVLIQ